MSRGCARKGRKSGLTLSHHRQPEGLARDLRASTTPKPTTTCSPRSAHPGRKPPGARRMRTGPPRRTPRPRPPGPPPPPRRRQAPRRLPPPPAASRRSKASEPSRRGRLLQGPGRGHHLAPSLRDHTSRGLASAATLEMFLQIGEPPAPSELASV